MYLVTGAPDGSVRLISVLHANFCWLEHLGKMICPWKERVAGKETVRGV